MVIDKSRKSGKLLLHLSNRMAENVNCKAVLVRVDFISSRKKAFCCQGLTSVRKTALDSSI